MNTEPTETDINRGIAEWMGWTTRIDPEGTAWLVRPDGTTNTGNVNSTEAPWQFAPHYTCSHDACHEALERMGSVNRDKVLGELCGSQIDTQLIRARVADFVLCASPRKVALAIYRTITTKP